jgi:putative tryptophan/tyrosine transport system substrate-binding protein
VISRRDVLASCAALLSAPLCAVAQEIGKRRRVGYLSVGSREGVRMFTDTFSARLNELGWPEPKLLIEYRFAGGDFARLPQLAADLVALHVDVIYAPTRRSVPRHQRRIPEVNRARS